MQQESFLSCRGRRQVSVLEQKPASCTTSSFTAPKPAPCSALGPLRGETSTYSSTCSPADTYSGVSGHRWFIFHRAVGTRGSSCLPPLRAAVGSGYYGGSRRERSGSQAARAGFTPASWGDESQPNATLQSQQVPRAE